MFAAYLRLRVAAGKFCEHVGDALRNKSYDPAMFAGHGGVGAVGGVGVLPPHAINEPIAIAIASRFIVSPY
jgi:hypothetical protein